MNAEFVQYLQLQCLHVYYGAGHTIDLRTDSTWSSIDGEAGELIALSPNETILASYHGKKKLSCLASTLERVGEFHFDYITTNGI